MRMPGRFTAIAAAAAATAGALLAASTLAGASSGPAAAPKATPNPAAVGSPVKLGETVRGGTSPFTYSWSISARPPGSTAALSDPSVAAPSITPDAAGSYQLSLTVTDSTGRSTSPSIVDVQAYAVPGPLVSAKASPDPAAAGSLVKLGETVRGGTTPYAYKWSLSSRPAGSSAVLNNPSSATPTISPDVAGTYQLSLTVVDSRGISTQPALVDLEVFATPGPTAAATAKTNPATIGSTVTLGETVRGGAKPYSYGWSLTARPPGSSAVLNNPSSATPTLSPDIPGTYQLTLTVTDSHGLGAPAAFVDLQAI